MIIGVWYRGKRITFVLWTVGTCPWLLCRSLIFATERNATTTTFDYNAFNSHNLKNKLKFRTIPWITFSSTSAYKVCVSWAWQSDAIRFIGDLCFVLEHFIDSQSWGDSYLCKQFPIQTPTSTYLLPMSSTGSFKCTSF